MAQVAVEKASHLVDVKPRIAAAGDDLHTDPRAMGRAMSRRTGRGVGRAPHDSYGVADVINALAASAMTRRVPLQRDGGGGGIRLPCLKRRGHPALRWDIGRPRFTLSVHTWGGRLKKCGRAAAPLDGPDTPSVLHLHRRARRHEHLSQGGQQPRLDLQQPKEFPESRCEEL